MKQLWLFGTLLLCVASIALSCVWVVSPTTLAAQYPTTNAADGSYYQLIDEGGYVTVLHLCDGVLLETATQTNILVNLLPEQDALRVKAGLRLANADALADTLAALGGNATASAAAP